MDKLFLDKELVTGVTLTQDGVLAYIALRTIIDESIPLYNGTSTEDCVSLNRMAYALIGSQEKYGRVSNQVGKHSFWKQFENNINTGCLKFLAIRKCQLDLSIFETRRNMRRCFLIHYREVSMSCNLQKNLPY